MTSPVTIDLDDETLSALDELAGKFDRSRSELVNQALEEWLAGQAWQIAKVEAGLAAAARGEFATEEDVVAVFGKHGAVY